MVLESVLNVASPKAGEQPEDTLSPKSCISDNEDKEKLEVTERNTFLEVDSRGQKTLSIFRCYTSPVYRRLFSGTSSGIGSTTDLGSLEESEEESQVQSTGAGSILDSVPAKKYSGNLKPGLESVEEELSDKSDGLDGRPSATLSIGSDFAVDKMVSASSIRKGSVRKLKQNHKDSAVARQFTADLEPFGKFEKFELEPLNTGGRKHSMMAPAPLSKGSSLKELPTYEGSGNRLGDRRGSKGSDGFHSAICSPVSTKNKADTVDLPVLTPLALAPNEDNTSPKKVRVKEDHGGVPEHLCTTIMVRNIPNKYSQRMLHEVFVQFGFDGTFDFLYVPADFFHRLNLGYCFVNFKRPEFAQQFARIFQDYHLPAFKSKKKIQISLANTQGFMPNVMKLEHTALCSQYVSPEFHPICIDPETGEERAFLSFFPGYKPPPKSRLEDPAYWGKHDATWQKQWEEDTLYPPVYIKENDRTSKNGPSFSPAEKQHSGGAPSRNNSRRTNNSNGNRRQQNNNRQSWM